MSRQLPDGKCHKAASWLALALLLGLSGCSWTDRRGTHHLIVGIGFGIITTTNTAGVEVSDSSVLGLLAGQEGAGAGWMRHHRVVIDPALASNAVISVKSSPGRLTIKNFDPGWLGTNDWLSHNDQHRKEQ